MSDRAERAYQRDLHEKATEIYLNERCQNRGYRNPTQHYLMVGVRALKSSRWEWWPGMVCWSSRGDTAFRGYRDSRDMGPEAIPDFRDQATLACLERIVRREYGSELLEARFSSSVGWGIYSPHGPDPEDKWPAEGELSEAAAWVETLLLLAD